MYVISNTRPIITLRLLCYRYRRNLEYNWEDFVDDFDAYDSEDEWVSDNKGTTEFEWEVVED